MNDYATPFSSPTEVNNRLTKLERQLDEMKRLQAILLQNLQHPRPNDEDQQNRMLIGTGQRPSLEVKTEQPWFSSACTIRAPADSSLVLQTDRELKTKARCIQLHAPSILMESNSVTIAGELTAKMTYSKPFVWRSGQKRIRMYHAEQGFPILTRIESSTKGENMQAQFYIDPVDQHWYLEGHSGSLELEGIFIGKP